jgi:hypothetical protein
MIVTRFMHDLLELSPLLPNQAPELGTWSLVEQKSLLTKSKTYIIRSKFFLNCSRNVTEGCNALRQIMMGSMDTTFCILLVSIGLWLEISLCRIPNKGMLSPYLFCFSNDTSIPRGGQKGKVLVQTLLQKVFKSEEFTPSADGVNHNASNMSTRQS